VPTISRLEIFEKGMGITLETSMTEKVDANLKEIVLKTIEAYNKYRSPEATAKLIEIKNHYFIIGFK
jgi:hypothetical protein